MNKLVHRSQLFVKRNSSTILTCLGAAGVVATAVTAVKATPKVIARLEQAQREKGEDLTELEVVKTAAPAYIPSILIGTATMACIFGANALNKRQQASLMSAYALLDSSYKDYKKKVGELYGDEVDNHIKAEVAKDKYELTDIKPAEDKKLFYDYFSERYFESTIEEVQTAEYQINRDLSMRDYGTVNEFYAYLKLDPIPGGDELGWSSGMNFDYYWQTWIDFGHNKVVMDDGLECIIITMFNEPQVGWDDYA